MLVVTARYWWVVLLRAVLSAVLRLVLVFQPAAGALGPVTTIGVFSIAWGGYRSRLHSR